MINKKWYSAGFFVATFFFFSCENWSSVEKLQTEVENIHDAPMMQIDLLEKWQHQAAAKLSSPDSLKMRAFISQANQANEAMFAWMNQYHAPEKGKISQKEAIVYLTEQKKQANLMSDLVLKAVADGKKLFK
jgi:hypothetical protein